MTGSPSSKVQLTTSEPMVWHPVRHKPKTIHGWYLVAVAPAKNTARCVTLGWWNGEEFSETWNYDNGHKMGRITHWMPMPEVPK